MNGVNALRWRRSRTSSNLSSHRSQSAPERDHVPLAAPAFSCHDRKCWAQCDSRHHPRRSSDLCFGIIIGWPDSVFHLACVGQRLRRPLIDITCLVYCGMEMGWQDRKAAAEGLAVNARRDYKDLWMALDYYITGSSWHARYDASSRRERRFPDSARTFDDGLQSRKPFLQSDCDCGNFPQYPPVSFLPTAHDCIFKQSISFV